MDADDEGVQPGESDLAVRQPFRQAQGPEPVEGLLAEVRHRFYGEPLARDFHRDRRMLLYALTWPAVWLERRALTCSAQRYHALVTARLGDIALHGDPARYGAYFPAYLLKCLQDWFQHHGDDLCEQLKHIRNALDQVLASVSFAAAVQRDAQHTELLAATHHLIHARRPQRENTDGRQLSLF